MRPAETPQEYLEYFQSLALSHDSSHAKWTFGLQAAQLWKTYHDTEPAPSSILQEFVRVLMPYRAAGSGFYGLWLSFLNHLQQLPIKQQVPVWRIVFDPASQGDKLVDHIDVADSILCTWEQIDSRGTPRNHAIDDINKLLETFGPNRYHAYEWFALASAIDQWFSMPTQQHKFMSEYLKRYEQS